mmetsp:Transcript_8025/g.22572  ORF Transcript_8025/g.22572 Transcript_8025/m.22572 type:complete len:246 (+) Transcript_8025:424-1161(+)
MVAEITGIFSSHVSNTVLQDSRPMFAVKAPEATMLMAVPAGRKNATQCRVPALTSLRLNGLSYSLSTASLSLPFAACISQASFWPSSMTARKSAGMLSYHWTSCCMASAAPAGLSCISVSAITALPTWQSLGMKSEQMSPTRMATRRFRAHASRITCSVSSGAIDSQMPLICAAIFRGPPWKSRDRVSLTTLFARELSAMEFTNQVSQLETTAAFTPVKQRPTTSSPPMPAVERSAPRAVVIFSA